tara:strand:+ start:589 stop:759 length:171 start_codon:yes stop_codon:yes gene_type:complete
MSWKFIFNTTVGDKWWSIIVNAEKAAKESGYKFFSWNGHIYKVDGGKTGITTQDCY